MILILLMLLQTTCMIRNHKQSCNDRFEMFIDLAHQVFFKVELLHSTWCIARNVGFCGRSVI